MFVYKISFVLVNYCGAFDTIVCIKSLAKTYGDIIKEVVVIDNNSPHAGVYDIIKAFDCDKYSSKFENLSYSYFTIENHTHIYVVKNMRNDGFGSANNIGIRFVKFLKSDVCVLLNNDTLTPSFFVSNIISFLKEKDYKCAFSVISRYFSEPTKIDSEGFGYLDLCTGRSSHYKHYTYKYLVGSCIIMNFVQSIPLFDENFFLYNEDADYSLLLQKAGYVLLFDSNNYFLHKVSASTSFNPCIERIKLRSLIYFMIKHASHMQFVIFCITRCIYYLIHLRFSYLLFYTKTIVFL